MKSIIGIIALIILVFTACKSDHKPANKNDEKGNEKAKIEDVKGYQDIEILFNDDKFGSDEEAELLNEIKICSNDPNLTANSEVPPCSPENFKFLPLQKDISIKNGFILIIKAETGGFPLRRVLIFQRERGELIKLNGFVANIIGRIPADNGYDDLIIRFRDKDEAGVPMFYNCIFTWKDSKYEYKHVDAIQGPNWGGKVKEADRVEYSKSVYESIMNNQMIF